MSILEFMTVNSTRCFIVLRELRLLSKPIGGVQARKLVYRYSKHFMWEPIIRTHRKPATNPLWYTTHIVYDMSI